MDITVKELKDKIDKGEEFVLIDVREDYEFEEFNLDGKLIPLGNFPSVIPNLEEHKDKEIIIHCRSGRRSAMAQQMLQQAGFANVKNLEGGVLAWIEEFGA
ncbi:MAG: rhodanese-like domain-containing protein [Bacteroidota bacterium]